VTLHACTVVHDLCLFLRTVAALRVCVSVCTCARLALVARDERQRFNAFRKKVDALEPHPERLFAKYSTISLRWAWSMVLSRGFKLSDKQTDDSSVSDRPFLAPGSGKVAPNAVQIARLVLMLRGVCACVCHES